MRFHFFSLFGMWGRMGSDLSMKAFTLRVKDLGCQIHNSPYDDTQATALIPVLDDIPEDEGLFLAGTSLGANNIALMANKMKRRVDGLFGFQASLYGVTGYPLNSNVKFAHLIYSYNPIPFPGLGAYKWPLGTMNTPSYHKTAHHIPHPGDYDKGDQDMYLGEMQRIMVHT